MIQSKKKPINTKAFSIERNHFIRVVFQGIGHKGPEAIIELFINIIWPPLNSDH
jgi:hypothetical protein